MGNYLYLSVLSSKAVLDSLQPSPSEVDFSLNYSNLSPHPYVGCERVSDTCLWVQFTSGFNFQEAIETLSKNFPNVSVIFSMSLDPGLGAQSLSLQYVDGMLLDEDYDERNEWYSSGFSDPMPWMFPGKNDIIVQLGELDRSLFNPNTITMATTDDNADSLTKVWQTRQLLLLRRIQRDLDEVNAGNLSALTEVSKGFEKLRELAVKMTKHRLDPKWLEQSSEIELE